MVDFYNLIVEINKELKGRFPDYKGAYFHGSRLKGNANEDSDYDLVFVFEREIGWRFKREISDLIYEFELKYGIVIDMRVFDSKEIKTPTSFFKELVRDEGKYYAA